MSPYFRPSRISFADQIKVALDLEVLESRTPVSEQLSTVLGIAVFAAAVDGLAGPERPAGVAPAGRIDPGARPPDGHSLTQDIALVNPPERPAPPPVDPAVPSPLLREWGNLDSPLPSPLAVDFEIRGLTSSTPAGHAPFPASALRFPSANTDGGASAAGPPSIPAASSATPSPDDPTGPRVVPVLAGAPDASPAPVSGPVPPAGSGSGNRGGGNAPPAPPVTIWVLDADNALVVADATGTTASGVIYHGFSQWSVDLRAQVAGAVVSSYSWDVSGAPDATSVSGQNTYNLTFTWADFTQDGTGPHPDTIVLTTVDPVNGSKSQNITFSVAGTHSPAWVLPASRPTTASTWPTVITPDAIRGDQETIDGPYYRVSQTTGELVIAHTLPRYHPAIAPLTLEYSSLAADRQPIFVYHQLIDPAQGLPSTVSAQLSVKQGATTYFAGQAYYYDTSRMNLGDFLQSALQATGLGGLATGRYNYKIDITPIGNGAQGPSGKFDLVNSAADIGGIFGNGWSLAGLHRLVPVTNGVILDLGAGQSLWFAANGPNNFVTPPGDFSQLTYDGSATYTRVLPDGTRYTFNNAGRETSMADRNGRTFTYAYDGSGHLLAITDFNNQQTSFGYTDGEVTAITDPAGRVTALGYDGANRLNQITDPAPGYGGATPVFSYTYDGSDHIYKLVDPRSLTTSFAYNFAGRVTTVTRADNVQEQLTALQLAGLLPPGTASTTGSAVPPVLAVQAQAQYTDGNSNAWNMRPDWLGFGRLTQATDPLGNQAVTNRDANGLGWMVADQLGRRTRSFFDPNGNATTIALADENQELSTFTYTYNSVTYSYAGLPASYTDATGDVTTFVRDASGNLLWEIDPPVTYNNVWTNAYTTFTYLPGGWVQKIQQPRYDPDPTLNTTSFGYDNLNRLLTITYPGSTVPTVGYGYDSNGNVQSRKDERGNTVTVAYDNLNRPVVVKLPVDSGIAVYSLAYDAAGNLNTITYPLQTLWTYSYDNLNRLIGETDPLQHSTTYGYDGAGNLMQVKDARLNSTTYGYDAANHRTSVEDALLHTTSLTVDAAGQRIAVTDPLNHTTSFGYNARGWLSSVTTALGDQVTYGYDAVGSTLSVTRFDHGAALSVTEWRQYDNMRRVTTYTDALGHSTTYTYGLNGNLLTAYGPHPNGGPAADPAYGGCGCGLASFAYDVRGRQIGQTDSKGKTTTRTYDGAGNVTSIAYPSGDVTAFRYDAQNRAHTVAYPPITLTIGQPPVSASVVYGYDLDGNLASVTDPMGNVTGYHYDSADRLWYVTDPRGKPTTYTYYDNNRLKSIQDPLNQTRSFAYDAADRLTGETWLDSLSNVVSSMVYGYDAADRLTSAGDPSATLAFGYDAADRLTSAATSYSFLNVSVVLNYGYDGFDNRTGLSDNIQSNDLITYSYDADFHLTGATWKVGGTTVGQISLHYDGRNRLDALDRFGPGLVSVHTFLGYDANDQILAMSHSKYDGAVTTALASFAYTYDDNRRLLTSQGPEGSRTYVYDAVNELLGVTATNANLNESYLYDLDGNRTSANGVNYGAVTVNNWLPSDGVYTYTYDDNGNVTVKASANDTTTFTWDYRKRLIEAREQTPTTLVDDTFTYDVFDRRVSKSINGVQQYGTAYDGVNAYADYVGGNWIRYLAGDQVDELFARYDTNASAIEWYLTDRLGSVRAVVNGSGTVVDTIYYDSFGNIPAGAETNPSNGDRFKFTGREWDGEIGQYFYRERYYSPSIGRFDSEDPIGFAGGDVNSYRYVGNGPTNGIDPTGLQGEDKPYDKKNYLKSVVKTDAAGTKFVIYHFLPGKYFFGVLY